MARYIDADALIKVIFPYDVVDKKCYTINAKMIYETIQKAPTADVAPKSDVAREIFAEIDKIFRNYYKKCSENSELKLLDPIRQCERFVINEMWDDLTELKKKYTEGQK